MTWNNWISKCLNSNFRKYHRRLSDILSFVKVHSNHTFLEPELYLWHEAIRFLIFEGAVEVAIAWLLNYLCNKCLSRLTWVRTPLRWGVCNTTLCDKVCQWLTTGRWFSPCPLVSSTNKTDRHDITEMLLKVALSTIQPTNKSNIWIPNLVNLLKDPPDLPLFWKVHS